MAKKQQRKNKPRKNPRNKTTCEKCGSLFGYIRLRSNEWVCRSCGHVQINDKTKKEKKGD